MTQHIFGPEILCEDVHGLVDNRGVGDDINDPIQSECIGLRQGKGQRRKGLAAAGGDGKGVKAPLVRCTVAETTAQDPIAGRVDGFGIAGVQPPNRLGLHFCVQLSDGRAVASVRRCTEHKGLGVQKVGIYKAGVEHPGIEAVRIAADPGESGGGVLWYLYSGLPWLYRPFGAAQQSGVIGGVVGGASVGQAAVMACHGKCRGDAALFQQHLSTGSGVIDLLGTAKKPALKGIRALAVVVVQAGQLSFLCQSVKAAGLSKLTRHLPDVVQMFCQRLSALTIFTDMGEKMFGVHMQPPSRY